MTKTICALLCIVIMFAGCVKTSGSFETETHHVTTEAPTEIPTEPPIESATEVPIATHRLETPPQEPPVILDFL